MYNRMLTNTISNKIGKGKDILLVGPRQVGKTTLIKALLEDKDYLFLDADDVMVRSLLDTPNTLELQALIGQYKYVFIDEAQRIKGIGLTLKIITDQFKSVQLFVSGSSSFELANTLNEPLTGRKWEYELLPISWSEFQEGEGFLRAEQLLTHRLLYGFYPDVLNHFSEEKEVLKQLVTSYLYRDVLAFSTIRKPDVLEKLVRALALQIGSEVNYTELAQMVGVDRNTVINYIDILEKGYVVFRLSSYVKNIRNEIKKSHKIYFYDNGVRNMIIANFTPLELRQDKGALWENFLIAERVKKNNYERRFVNMYFWRTAQRQEIDYIEEYNGELTAYEFKWNAKKKVNVPLTFSRAYNADFVVIDRSNFRDFVQQENK